MLSLKPPALVSFAFIVVFLLALLLGYGQSAQEITPLEAKQSIDRELTTGEDQVYHLTLAAGEYARVEL